MLKPSAAGTFKSAVWIVLVSSVAVALLATAGIGVSAHMRTTHRSAAAQPASAQPTLNTEQRSRIQAGFGALPLAFEANQGQTDPQVKYMARGNGYTVYLTGNDTVFALQSSPAAASVASKQGIRPTTHPTSKAANKTAAIRMHLIGGNAQPQVSAVNQLPGHSNYFIGNDHSQWKSNVPQYARVSYRDVYPGVNMAYYGQQKQLEFDFIVAPGASVEPIRLGITGATRVATDDSGNLVLASSAGDVLLHKPVAYQQKDGAREPVDARFVLLANHQVSFALGNYDRSRELVIDPSVTYATYLGGVSEDDGYAIAIDGSGNAYVTGQTASTGFPTVAGAYKTANAGGFDVFVTKINASGSALIYSTFVGGSGNDSGNAIAVDASGNAFVAGGTTSSSNFPVTAGAYQTTFGGGSVDAFVFELSSSGGSLTYSTYVGGNLDDVATGLALAKDSSGDIFIVGSTGSTNFPTTAGTIQTSIKGTSNGFVTKLNSSGSALVYSTYLGGGTGDLASAVAVDASNHAYVTGSTQNSTFPTTPGAFQTTCGTTTNCNGGLDDAFVSVIKADGSGFVYSTFLGGSNADQGLGIAVDSAGDAYVTGLTLSNTDFPTKGAVQPTYGGGAQDAFITAFNPGGSALIYSTYLGGAAADAGAGIAVDANNNAYVTGQTGSSTGFPTTNATQAALKGGNDAFVTVINGAGTQWLFSTYLGGSLNENSTSGLASVSPIGAITVDSAGANVYVTGNTNSTDFPATTGTVQTTNKGGAFDAFVAKYSLGTSTAGFTVTNGALSPTSGAPGVSATATITVGSTNGFNSAVALTCSVAPVVTKGPTCSLNPNSVTPPANGTITSALSVGTVTAAAMIDQPSNRHSSPMLYALLLPVGITLLGAGMGSAGSRRRKLLGFLMLGIVLTGLLVMPACGGGNSNTGGGNTGTPAGTYTITVSGSANGAVVTGAPALTLTVN